MGLTTVLLVIYGMTTVLLVLYGVTRNLLVLYWVTTVILVLYGMTTVLLVLYGVDYGTIWCRPLVKEGLLSYSTCGRSIVYVQLRSITFVTERGMSGDFIGVFYGAGV